MANFLNTNLRILYWNARSISHKKELKKILQNVDIFVCMETWLNDDDTWCNNDVNNGVFDITGFKTFRKDRPNRQGGGILILIRNHLAYTDIKNLTSPDITVEIAGLTINNLKHPIDIIACYRAPGQLTQLLWDSIINNVKNNKHTVFMGDFNAHHTSWN